MTYTDHDGADPTRACTRKKAYPSEQVARLAIDTIRRVNPDAEVRPYACRNCGQWHVGATPVGARLLSGDLTEVRDAERIRDRIGINKPKRRHRPGDFVARRRRVGKPRHDPRDRDDEG